MNQNVNLAGLGVLITRPIHQAQELCNLIQVHGGCPLLFPVITIEPVINSALAQELFSQTWDIVIYTSSNAVQFAAQLLANSIITSNVIIAIGMTTAKALNCKPDFIPERQDSEGLLALPILTQPVNKKILIIRGVGGRTLLSETLIARGALVSIAEVYQRNIAKIDVEPILAQWEQNVNVVIATSGEILDNLILLIGPNGQSKLLNTPLITISERLCRYAKNLGFTHIILSASASDAALLNAILLLIG